MVMAGRGAVFDVLVFIVLLGGRGSEWRGLLLNMGFTQICVDQY